MEGLSYETIMVVYASINVALNFVDCKAISKYVKNSIVHTYSSLFQRAKSQNKQVLDRLDKIEDKLDSILAHQHLESIKLPHRYRYKRHH